MNRLGLRIALGLLLGAALQGLLEAPASLVPWLLRQGNVTLVQVADAQDSLWSGNALLTVQPLGAAPVPLGRWRWALGLGPGLRPQLHLASVLAAGPPGTGTPGVGTPAVTGMLDVLPGGQHVALHQVHLQAAATAVPATLAWWALLQARGQLALDAEALQLGPEGLRGTADLTWRDAAVAQSPVVPLGSWAARLELEGAEGHYQLRTLNGPLTLTGAGRIALDGRVSLQGFARSDPASQAALQPLLGLLGTPDDSGRVAIALPWRAAPPSPDDTTGR